METASALKPAAPSAPPAIQPGKFYLPFVDGLRALSILLVLGFHQLGPVSGWMGKQLSGWVGVDLFFVISGFLITSIILKEQNATGTFNLKNFYTRRWLRIFPAYYFFLSCMLVFGLWRGQPATAYAVAALYLTNLDAAFGWGLVPGGSGVGHTWSLSIEEQFYLTFAPCAFFLRRRLVFLAVAVIAGAYFWRLALLDHGALPLRLLGGFDTKIDSIMYGVLAAHLCQLRVFERGAFKVLADARVQLAVGAAMLVAFHFLGHPGEGAKADQTLFWALKYPLALALMALLIVSLCADPGKPLGRWLSAGPLVWVGRLSYSLYLWHVLPMFPQTHIIIDRLCHGRRYLVEIMTYAICFAAAYFSYRFIESPFLKMKRKFSTVQTAA